MVDFVSRQQRLFYEQHITIVSNHFEHSFFYLHAVNQLVHTKNNKTQYFHSATITYQLLLLQNKYKLRKSKINATENSKTKIKQSTNLGKLCKEACRKQDNTARLRCVETTDR